MSRAHEMKAGPSRALPSTIRTTLTGDIFRKMVTYLIRGDWKPGDRIPPERELRLQLNVGRASLREALKALEIMGMLETRLGSGTYVCEKSEFLSRPLLWAIASGSVAETNELVEARELLEVEMAGLATERASTDDLKEIGLQLEEMEKSVDDVERFLQADIAFHLAVGRAAHNNILMNALHLIRNLLRNWLDTTLRMEGVIPRVLSEHQQIFLAIVKKNRSAAREAMQEHLEDMADFLRASKNGVLEEKDHHPALPHHGKQVRAEPG
jgi:GntR family transcriptional repressor for pyruvate dehydrogenase complex